MPPSGRCEPSPFPLDPLSRRRAPTGPVRVAPPPTGPLAATLAGHHAIPIKHELEFAMLL